MSRARRLAAWSAAAIAALLMTGAPAYAQLAGSPRIYRGLFGADRSASPAEGRHSLDLSASADGGYDDNLLASQRDGRLEFGQAPSGYLSTATAGLTYLWRTEPVGIYANTQVTARYFPGQETVTKFYSSNLGASFASALGSRGRLTATPSVSFLSRERLRLLDVADRDAGFLDQVDYTVTDRGALRYAVNASVSHELGRRTSISGSAGASYSDIQSLGIDSRTVSASMRLTRQLGRSAAVYVGYGRYRAENVGSDVEQRPLHRQSIDIGADLGRARSLTRRTTLAFSTGSSFTPREQDASGRERGMRAHLTGAATLAHQLGRSWSAQAAYGRNVRYIEELGELVLSDSAAGGIAGYLTRRLDLAIVAAYSNGSNMAQRDRQYSTYTGSAQMRYGLTQHVAVFAQYLSYYYKFAEGVALLRNLPPGIHRQSVHVGVTLWTPLLK